MGIERKGEVLVRQKTSSRAFGGDSGEKKKGGKKKVRGCTHAREDRATLMGPAWGERDVFPKDLRGETGFGKQRGGRTGREPGGIGGMSTKTWKAVGGKEIRNNGGRPGPSFEGSTPSTIGGELTEGGPPGRNSL